MAMFALLELLSWRTLSDEKVRVAAMAIIGLFAVRTWVHHRRELLAGGASKTEGERE
jgi:hypothetical protein